MAQPANAPNGPAGTGVVRGAPKAAPARRASPVSRATLAANDDAPSIGGLIFALQQKPSRTPFFAALIGSALWAILGTMFSRNIVAQLLPENATFADILSNPSALAASALIVLLPIGLFWFLATLVWRAQELRLMSSAMTEVAVRLAEPDKMAEQSVASLGQTVRRQVAAMNDAISRALGRAGELEALVHNEVAALERSYTENEHRIRNLINELATEREALANNSERVTEALRGVGSQVTREIGAASEKAAHAMTQASSSMADTLASRGHKITSAVTAAGAAIDEKLAERGARITEQLVKHGAQTAEVMRQSTLEVTKAIQESSDRATQAISAKGNTLVSSVMSMSERVGREIPVLLDRLGGEQTRLSGIIENATRNLSALEGALTEKTASLGGMLGERTKMLQGVLDGQIRHLDTSMADRIQTLESMLSRRAQAFDTTMAERTKTLETSVLQRTQALESAVTRYHGGMKETLETHAVTLEKSLSKQSQSIERTVTASAQNIQRAVDELSRRSGVSSETLANQAQILKDVSGGLMSQIHALTKRFEDQGATIMNAARQLEVSNMKVDTVMEARQAALAKLLDSINTRAIELDRMMGSYSHMLDQSLSNAEVRARKVTEVLAKDSAEKSQAAIREIERLRTEAQAQTTRAVTELQSGFTNLSDQVQQQLSTLSTKFGETSKHVKASATKAVAELEQSQTELRRQATSLPEVTRQSASAMRKVLNEQLAAIGSLSELAGRQNYAMQVSKPASSRESMSQPPELPEYGRPPMPEPGRKEYAPPPQQQQQHREFPPQPGNFPQGQPGNYPQGQTGNFQQSDGGDNWDSADSVSSLTAGLSQRFEAAKAAPQWNGQPEANPAQPQQDGGAQWSLGDLLARASEDEYPSAPGGYGAPPGYPPAERNVVAEQVWTPPAPVDLGMEEMAAAMEPQRVLDVWTRYNRGDRNAINRGIYNPQGQQTFDKVRRRYETDNTFRHIADRYVADFENLLKDAARNDPKGRAIQDNLTSDTGRIYLLLAHASGRLN